MTDYMVSREIVEKKQVCLVFVFSLAHLSMVELDNFPISGELCV